MAKKAKKSASRWLCRACNHETQGWYGKCPDCGAWNTIEEQLDPSIASDRVVLDTGAKARVISSTAAQKEIDARPRLSTGLGEVDRVLGGGLVAGSVVLLGGPPGIGKSTLLLQASASLARRAGPVLYASGEESVAQVGSRAARLGAPHKHLLLVAETRIEAVLEAATERAGELAALIVDSIQTVYSDAHEGLPGNATQLRAVASQLVSFAKRHGVPVVVVGHVTKDGQLAGPRLLEHLVDAVLSFEGDEERATRLLRAVKNRFGSTQELGVFEMRGEGLREITNPSEAFLGDRTREVIGACVTASIEGSRPLLLEIQALLAASFGNPRRTCVGFDAARLAMLMAVLDRHGGLFVLDQDVFVNVVGGMRLHEPACDLAALLAVASSHLKRPVPRGLLALGEVGLTGELRPAPRTEARLAEAARLGFRRVLTPTAARGRGKVKVPAGVTLEQVSTVPEAIERCFGVAAGAVPEPRAPREAATACL
ncbi:MAG: DNA repair protein RadA [Myxococcales bacterium]|nr:DNA repair protein RadA [Myxococcales bacterium]